MVKVTRGITPEDMVEVYSHPSMQKLACDELPSVPIIHNDVLYFSVHVNDEFMGAYMAVMKDPFWAEVHMLLLPKIGKYQRKASIEFLGHVLSFADYITASIFEDMPSAINHAKKVGFEHEKNHGTSFHRNGKEVNTYIYRLNQSKYKELQWAA